MNSNQAAEIAIKNGTENSLRTLLRQETLRADLLQQDLDVIDEQHFDEIADLYEKIADLTSENKKLKTEAKRINFLASIVLILTIILMVII